MGDGATVTEPACLAGSGLDSETIDLASVDLTDMEVCGQVCEYLRLWASTHPEVDHLMCFASRGVKMNTDSAKMVARIVLPVLPNLTRCYFAGHSEMGDEGVEAMVVSLQQHCCKLQLADFRNLGMTDVGFDVVCRHLPAANLKYLYVDGNQITRLPAAFRRFRQLETFGTIENPWSDEWQPRTISYAEIIRSALDYAETLPFDGDDEGEVMIKPASMRARLEEDEE